MLGRTADYFQRRFWVGLAALFCVVFSQLAQALPTIVTQPVDATGVVGGSVSLSVVATGPGVLHYQWRKSSVVSTVVSGFTVPAGVAVDAVGNLYVTDVASHTVSVVTPQGALVVIAGSLNQPGVADGLGSDARFNEPAGIAIDASGNLFVADRGNHTIRKLRPSATHPGDWEVETIAGLAGSGGSTNGDRTSARLDGPESVAVHSDGTVYVGDRVPSIRTIAPNGDVNLLAGGSPGSANGNGSAAQFNFPGAIAVDADGNVYVADVFNHMIRKVTPAGDVTTVAGSATEAGNTDGVGTVSARFSQPWGIVVLPNGSLLVSDGQGTSFDGSGNLVQAPVNHLIRQISPLGAVFTVAGSPSGSGNVEGPGINARFNNPYGLALGGSGDLFVVDEVNGSIRRVQFGGAIAGATDSIFTITGANVSDSGPYECVVVLGATNVLSAPAIVSVTAVVGGAAYDGVYTSSIVLPDGYTHTESDFVSGGIVSGTHHFTNGSSSGSFIWSATVASVVGAGGGYEIVGGGVIHNQGDRLFSLVNSSIQFDAGTNVYTLNWSGVDSLFGPIGGTSTFSPNGTGVPPDSVPSPPVITQPPVDTTVLAGGTASFSVTATGTGTLHYQWRKSAEVSTVVRGFVAPAGVARDADGNLYVTDVSTHTVTMVTLQGVRMVIAGSLNQSGAADGPGPDARFNVPAGIAIDGSGNLIVADRDNHTVRKLTRPTGSLGEWQVETIAGVAGEGGSANGTRGVARLLAPQTVAVHSDGTVYVGDSLPSIRTIAPNGDVTLLAGGSSGSANGIGSAAQFNYPRAIAVDADRNVYVADALNHMIRKVTPAGEVTTIAGSATAGGNTDGAALTTARFSQPWGIAVLGDGSLLVSDGDDGGVSGNLIRKISTLGFVTTLAGSPDGLGNTEGPGNSAHFNDPYGLALGDTGRFLVADFGNGSIREVKFGGVIVGATDPSYSITAVGVADAGAYECVVSAGSISVVSAPARLILDSGSVTPAGYEGAYSSSVTSPDGFTRGENDLVAGTNVSGTQIFSNGITDGAYMWNGVISPVVGSPNEYSIAGSGQVSYSGVRSFVLVDSFIRYNPTSNIYTLEWNAVDSMIGPIGGTSVFSPSGTVPSTASLEITAQPLDAIVASGGTVSLSVTALGSGTLRYQWKRSALVSTVARGFVSPAGVARDTEGNLYVTDFGAHTVSRITPQGAVMIIAGSLNQAGMDNGIGSQARFSGPEGIALDGIGNLFVADWGNHTIRKLTPSVTQPGQWEVSTIGGVGGEMGSGNGPRASARLDRPETVAVDRDGNVYVGDNVPSIRKIAPNGDVSLLAGGSYGFADGPGVSARFSVPGAIALDADRNVYVADVFNNVIRKVTPDGDVTTFAGKANEGGFADGAGKLVARFSLPWGIAVDTDGSVFISDGQGIYTDDNGIVQHQKVNHTVRRISPAGYVTTLAGSPDAFGEVEGAGSNARFDNPFGLTLDDNGSLYVVDGGNKSIRKVKLGNGVPGAMDRTYIVEGAARVDGGTYECVVSNGAAAIVSAPASVIVTGGDVLSLHEGAYTSAGVLSDGYRHVEYDVVVGNSVSGSHFFSNGEGAGAITWSGTLSLVAGSQTDFIITGQGTIRFNGERVFALVDSSIAFNPDTNVYTLIWNGLDTEFGPIGGVATLSSDGSTSTGAPPVITQQPLNANVVSGASVTLSVGAIGSGTLTYQWRRDAVVSTIAGSSGVKGITNGMMALFDEPAGVVQDSNGNVYVSDASSHTIRKIDPTGNVVTVAGKAGVIGIANGSGALARFNSPTGLAIDPEGNLYVADGKNNTIRKITPDGEVTTFAGIAGRFGGNNGLAQQATFNGPGGLAFDGSGNLYVADSKNFVIRKITALGVVSTFAGQMGSVGFTDGPAADARFRNPAGLAFDGLGNLYVADSSDHTIRKIATDGSVTTLAGRAGSAGGADGKESAARFNNPVGLAVDAIGNVYVGDELNHTIRQIAPDGVVTTVAGKEGHPGGQDGVSSVAGFNGPTGIAVDSEENLIVSDSRNHTMRKVKLGSDIPGETEETFTISSASEETDGAFYCLVTDSTGNSVQSARARVSVGLAPAVGRVGVSVNGGPVQQDTLAPVAINTSLVLSAAAGTDLSSVTYQWRQDGLPIGGAVNRTFSLGKVASVDQEGFYDVVVGNGNGSVIWTGVQVTLSQRPVTLSSQLAGLTVLAGSDVKWSGFVASESDQALTYEWRQGSKVVPGATTNTLELRAVTLSQAGRYTVTAFNSFSSQKSSADLTVLQPVGVPVITGDFVANAGTSMFFKAAVTGGAVRYQWALDGQPVARATGSVFRLSSDSIADGKSHLLAVRAYNLDGLGNVLSVRVSDNAIIRVRGGISIASVSLDAQSPVDLKRVVKFTVAVAGDTEGVRYQWMQNGVPLTGGTQASYSTPPATEAVVGSYSVAVSNKVSSVVSEPVVLNVKLPVDIRRHPAGRTVSAGTLVKLNVLARGAGVLSYQWRKDKLAIVDASNSAEYSFAMDSAGLAEGAYDVVVTSDTAVGGVFSVTSFPAQILLSSAVPAPEVSLDYPKILAGGTATFTVKTSAVGGSQFQWRRNGQFIPGGITQSVLNGGSVTSTLVLSRVKVGDQGDYDVLVRQGGTTVASALVRLEVFNPLKVTISPAGNKGVPSIAPDSGRVALSAVITGDTTAVFDYKWTKVGSSVVLSTEATFTVDATDVLSEYRVEISATSDVEAGQIRRSAISAPVPVQLLAPVTFTEAATSTTVLLGGTAVLSRESRGGLPIQYQWQQEKSGRWADVTGATSNQLSVSEARSSDGGLYRLSATNGRSSSAVVSETIKLTVQESDVIVTQPASVSVNPGIAAVFEVAAKGVDLSYQWRKNGVEISGATKATLTVMGDVSALASVDKSSRDGVYDVLVKHAFGSSLSTPARLSVNVPVQIDVQPVDTGLVVGSPARLFVLASGTPNLTYEWRKNGKALTGGTQSFYEIKSAALADAGTYTVVVGNVVAKVVSTSANVALLSAIKITKSPTGVTVDAGQTVRLKVEATGSGLTYQWRRDGVVLVEGVNGITGTTADTLVVVAGSADSSAYTALAGNYDVVVSDSNEFVTSAAATIAIKGAPVILVQPKNQTVSLNGAVSFTVKALGGGTLTYRWFVVPENGVARAVTSSADGRASFTGVAGSGDTLFGSQFYVVISNALNKSTTSSVVTLTKVSALALLPSGSQGASEAAAGESLEVGSAAARSLTRIVGGDSLTLLAPSVDAGALVLSYQWRRNGEAIAGATQSSYVVVFASKAVAGLYDVIVSGSANGLEKSRVFSSATLLRVNGAPEIAAIQTQSVFIGQKVVFAPAVILSGTGAVTYQWEKISGTSAVPVVSGTSASGAVLTVSATNPLLSIERVALLEGGSYRVTATDEFGSSAALAQLNVSPLLSVKVTANGAVVGDTGLNLGLAAKARLVLEATASGAGSGFAYQWRQNGVKITGATKARYEIASLAAAQAGRYDILVTGLGAPVSSPVVTLALVEPLKIVTQPVAQVGVNQGQSVGFSVAVNNPDQITGYQWLKGSGRTSAIVSGQTSSTLSIDTAKEDDAATYTAILTGKTGPTSQVFLTSTAVKVAVNLPAKIVVGPASQAALVGKPVNFQVTAGGTAPFRYQWLRNGIRIPGASASSFQLAAAIVNDAASYQVLVSNDVKPEGVLSEEAVLTVSKPVTIVTEPVDLSGVVVGDRVKEGGVYPEFLSVVAEGDGVLTYQWRRNGVALAGETASVLRAAKVSVFSAGQYDVVVRNTVGTTEVSRVVSRQATVQVEGEATGIRKEVVRVNQGDTAVLTAFAGTGQTASWVLGGTLGTATASDVQARTRQVSGVLSVRAVTLVDAGTYTATVTGGTATATVQWSLQVVSVPEVTKQPVPLVGKLAVHPKSDALLSAGLKVSSDKETDKDTRYQWFFQSTLDGTAYLVPGATTNTLKIKSVSALDEGYYRLEVRSPAGAISTEPARIHVLEAATSRGAMLLGGEVTGGSLGGTLGSGSLASGVLVGGSLTGGTVATSVDPNSNVTFSATATGDLETSGFPYQWYSLVKNVWTVIPKAVQPLLTLTGVTEGQDTSYRVRVFGLEGGAVDSAAIKLSVNDVVAFSKDLKDQSVSLAESEGVTLSLTVSGYRPQVQWYRDGQPLGPEITSSIVSGGTLVSYQIASAQAGDTGTYTVRLRNTFSDAGEKTVGVVSVRTAPGFEGQSGGVVQANGASVTTDAAGLLHVNEGGAFALSAQVAAQSRSFNYQWRRNGVAVSGLGRVSSGTESGAISIALEFAGGAVGADAGQYDLVIVNDGGLAVSNPVNVVVELKPSILNAPRALVVTKGGAATFSVDAIGAGTLSYQWYNGGVLISGATSRILSLENVSAAGSYAVRITNTLGEVTSTPVALGVSEPGSFSVSVSATLDNKVVSSPVSALPGAAFSLSAVVYSGSLVSTAAYSYQWRKDGVALSGGTLSVYGVAKLGGMASGFYDVVVTDGANYEYSAVVALDLDPRIVSVDVPTNVTTGDGVQMQVKATSAKTLSYQWLKEGKAIAGATKDIYVITSSVTGDSGNYTVAVSAKGGATATSDVRPLLVTGKIALKTPPSAQTVLEGSTLTLSVAGDNVTTYKWYRTLSGKTRTQLSNGSGVSGAATATLKITPAAVADTGVYEAEVSNPGGLVLSPPVSVKVTPKLAVTLTTPPATPVGGGLNLVATVVGASAPQYKWTFTAAGSASRVLSGQTTDQLKVAPITTADAGLYTVEVTSGSATVSASTTLTVYKVPTILVAPASQSVLLGGTVKLAVVADFAGTLSYQWYKGTGTSRVAVTGATTARLTKTNVASADLGIYTVRVSDSTNATAAVEASATLSSKTGTETLQGTVPTDAPTWWVYYVEGKEDSNSANDWHGYWILERLKDPNNPTNTSLLSSGNSVWVWAPNTVTDLVVTDSWALADEQIQEASENTRSEFSVIADRVAAPVGMFVMSGRVESGARMAIYGAPELIVGEYEYGSLLDVSMSWDDGVAVSAAIAGKTSLTAVASALAGILPSKASAPKGD